ncbi:hypothetical protein LWH48_12675 [Halomonas sp. G15]|uniref:hypothetical protein n=1 Tax=Halomonas sp. G15 TaxID=2903521 RepID=UPI001E2A675C|nr:hypothetical protein [Halomonas sp. G15]MCE0733634.1 hypothetical protein [Halomonas sp. G15]
MSNQEEIDNIILRYSEESILFRSSSLVGGGMDPLFPRLERAVMNQLDHGSATLSRYGIWANTVRDNIAMALELLEKEGEKEEVKRLLYRAANSLSAFSEIQAVIDASLMHRE